MDRVGDFGVGGSSSDDLVRTGWPTASHSMLSSPSLPSSYMPLDMEAIIVGRKGKIENELNKEIKCSIEVHQIGAWQISENKIDHQCDRQGIRELNKSSSQLMNESLYVLGTSEISRNY